MAYVIEGTAHFDKKGRAASSRELVVYSRDGEDITVETGDKPVRFLLLAGKPIGEPIAWYGPIVMNTWDEIYKALEELENGTFIKSNAEVRDY
jgi:Pirin-related protein